MNRTTEASDIENQGAAVLRLLFQARERRTVNLPDLAETPAAKD